MESSELQNILNRYSQCSESQQFRALCRFGAYLTLLGRRYYAENVDPSVGLVALKTFNEIRHSVDNQIIAFLEDPSSRYSNEALIEIIASQSRDFYPDMLWCWEQALGNSGW